MSKYPCRVSIAGAAVAFALLWSGSAHAQGWYPGQIGGNNPVVTGAVIDMATRDKAERRLHHLEAKIGQDAAAGNPAAVDRDARGIAKARYRIAVNEWLIRKNLLECDPGPYPWPLRMDCMTQAAMASVRRPPQAPGHLILPDYNYR